MVRKSDLYKVDGDKVERKNPICPRCGEGVFMADHGDRFACGKCGYTEMKKPGKLPLPGIEPRSPHYTQILYHLSHRGSPINTHYLIKYVQ